MGVVCPQVFRRYETTVALPVEYGALNVANVATGLLFYEEHQKMSASDLTLIICGLCVILVGIFIGQLRTSDAAACGCLR